MPRQFRGAPLARRALLAAGISAFALAAHAQDPAAIEKWVDAEFQPSTLTRDEQISELEWFAKAAEPFKGMTINVVSENIPTHTYESQTLTKAFEEITGIKVVHDLLQEGDVIEKLQTQLQSGQNVYDAYVNDSDLIGTHYRYGWAVPLSDYMTGEGADAQDRVMERLERANVQAVCGPKLNPKTSAEEWFARAEAEGTLAPQRKLENEKPQGETVVYEDLLKA